MPDLNDSLRKGQPSRTAGRIYMPPFSLICSGVVRRVRARPVAGGFPPPCSVFHFASRSLPSAVALFRALVKRLLLIPVTASEVRRVCYRFSLCWSQDAVVCSGFGRGVCFFVAEREDCVF
ncbi:hypothetical protein F2Q69_00001651 [Brassica cretica]|uniref:Uncharacterized protein n=1 Tax=Brassica cretica TaxID=69181 RepID=A0A8S9PFD5_BRACR|nr:hypothetical protein F2Q69_00001651 [Brassica cretica]